MSYCMPSCVRVYECIHDLYAHKHIEKDTDGQTDIPARTILGAYLPLLGRNVFVHWSIFHRADQPRKQLYVCMYVCMYVPRLDMRAAW